MRNDWNLFQSHRFIPKNMRGVDLMWGCRTGRHLAWGSKNMRIQLWGGGAMWGVWDRGAIYMCIQTYKYRGVQYGGHLAWDAYTRIYRNMLGIFMICAVTRHLIDQARLPSDSPQINIERALSWSWRFPTYFDRSSYMYSYMWIQIWDWGAIWGVWDKGKFCLRCHVSWYHKHTVQFLRSYCPARRESCHLLRQSTPSSSSCSKYGWCCHTTSLPHQGVLVSTDNFNIYS